MGHHWVAFSRALHIPDNRSMDINYRVFYMTPEQKCFRYKENEIDYFASILEGQHDKRQRYIKSHVGYRHAEIASVQAFAMQGAPFQNDAGATLQKRYGMFEEI